MAVKHISTTAIYYFLIYYIVRTHNDRLEFKNMPFDLAAASKRKIIGAFAELKRDGMLKAYRICDDGVVFSPSQMLIES